MRERLRCAAVVALWLALPAAASSQSAAAARDTVQDAPACGVCVATPAPALALSASPNVVTTSRLVAARAGEGANPWLIAGGAVLGGAVGGAIGCAINSDDYGVYCGGQSDTTVFVSAAIGAAIGGITVWLLTRD